MTRRIRFAFALCAVLLLPVAAHAQEMPQEPVRADGGMVVSQSYWASEVGAAVLSAGGNAVDAAIATGFAMAVTHPTAGNIGGGGFMVIRFPDGRTTAIDFREKAPRAAHPEMFLDSTGTYSPERHHLSHLAVGVPGTVAGFWMAHEQYGSAEWSELVGPAVDLAEEGFTLSESLARSLAGVLSRMEKYPASVAAFSKDGTPYEAGELFRQPDLARSLERIRTGGRDGFYLGETAELLAAEMERGGGIITTHDMANYHAVEREPVTGTYRGYTITSMPPPSSGGTALIQMLNLLEGYDLSNLEHNSSEHVHLLVESMRLAYLDRARHLADQDYASVPVARLTSKEYADRIRATMPIDAAGVSDSVAVDLPDESPETTHYSVVDGDGLAVSVTYTLEFGYGSGIVVPGAGFLLNNEMGDFNAHPGVTNSRGLIGTAPNLARPGQRMLSSMTPTILSRDGELVAVIGSPGGRTIINTVLQVALNVMDFDMNIQQAVNAKRLHHQWLPDIVRIEADGMDDAELAELTALGHQTSMRGRQGSVQAIMVDPETGEILGAADPRSEDARAVGAARVTAAVPR